jgi:glycosyltransferase involved in cell wall biosynthesis
MREVRAVRVNRTNNTTRQTGAAPRVSIGLPVFNGAEYLEASIDSLLAQTFGDFELIISDNASSDRTSDICHEYQRRDPRVHFCRCGENHGAIRNHQLVLELARGEYFKWASHDDVHAPTCLERCVQALDANPHAVMVFPRALDIDETGVVTRRHDEHFHADSSHPHVRFRYFAGIAHSCLPVFGLFRAKFLREIPLLSTYIGWDRVLLAEASLVGPFLEIPDDLFFRRDHADRVTLAAPHDICSRLPDGSRPPRHYPYWRMLAEYLHAIDRAHIGRGEKQLCRLELLWWSWRARRHLARDLRRRFS